MRARARLVQLLDRLASWIFVPLCPGGCRQPLDRCACDPRWRWL